MFRRDLRVTARNTPWASNNGTFRLLRNAFFTMRLGTYEKVFTRCEPYGEKIEQGSSWGALFLSGSLVHVIRPCYLSLTRIYTRTESRTELCGHCMRKIVEALNSGTETRNLKPETRNPKPETRDQKHKPGTRNQKHEIRNPKSEIRKRGGRRRR